MSYQSVVSMFPANIDRPAEASSSLIVFYRLPNAYIDSGLEALLHQPAYSLWGINENKWGYNHNG